MTTENQKKGSNTYTKYKKTIWQLDNVIGQLGTLFGLLDIVDLFVMSCMHWVWFQQNQTTTLLHWCLSDKPVETSDTH